VKKGGNAELFFALLIKKTLLLYQKGVFAVNCKRKGRKNEDL